MPSTKDPNSAVNPGPGKLPGGVVPAGALLFPPGGGSDAGLQAHIINPFDAHMASAIGVSPYYPPNSGPTPDPILTSVGGVVDGESVLDFINQFKDLIPLAPNSIGFSTAAGGTGVPNWGHLNALGVGTGTTVTGGYAEAGGTGQPVTFTHYLAPNSFTSFALNGNLFPADRGVLAFYASTNGNFFDSSHTTLVGALSLNDAAPAGIPNAAFNEALRGAQQTNYTRSGSGLDQFNLTFRLPYLTSYSAYPGTPFGPFSNNFYSFQLAFFQLANQTVANGNSQSFLLVHWKETYATTLASIQPASLTLASLTAAHCYSAVPVSGNFDDNTQPVYNVNKHNFFQDSSSASSPVGTVFTSAPAGTVTVRHLSGIQYYFSTGLEFNVDIRATGLFAQSFQTGSATSPPNVPLQFNSAFDPIQMDFTNFGGGVFPVPYYNMQKHGGSAYSSANTPQPGDTGEYVNPTLAIFTPALFCPQGGQAQLTADLRTPFHEAVYVDTNVYLFDTIVSGSVSTTTYEPFVDEFYRYASAFNQTTSATIPIIASGGNVWMPGNVLTVNGNSLQVMGRALGYPQTNYNLGTIFPAQITDYSGFPAGDSQLRRYVRAVDTGTARNTGWIRLRGLAQAAFTVNASYDGGETTGHTTGGCIVQIAVPGSSGSDWLDLGRQLGDPGIVGPQGTSPFYGCQTGVVISGSDIYVSYQTGSIFTSNNTSGNFLLFIRITIINNGNGLPLILDEFEWYPPTFTPP